METQTPVRKTKIVVEPQVYAVLLEITDGINYISLQCAYSLEEAFGLAKLEYEEQNAFFRNNKPFPGAKVSLFAIKTLGELQHAPSLKEVVNEKQKQLQGAVNDVFKVFNKLSKVDQVSPEPQSVPESVPDPKIITKVEKNKLMKQIIADKDNKSFELHKVNFTEAERSYIKEKLK